jgi:hypothetical protein
MIEIKFTPLEYLKHFLVVVLLVIIATSCFFISIADVNAVTITATGLPSKTGYDYTPSTHSYLDYCPLCNNYKVLIYHTGEFKGTYVPEGELSCISCGADYDIVSGQDKAHIVRASLIRAEMISFKLLGFNGLELSNSTKGTGAIV